MGWNPNMGGAGSRVSTSGSSFSLFVTLGWLVVIATAFILGYRLAYHDADNTLVEMHQLKVNQLELRENLMASEERVAGLEREQSIDRESKRLAQAQLEELQHDRHECAKQVSALERLIREGGGGVVQVQDFKLWETGAPNEFGYHFTLTQLIPEFGQTSGRVRLRVDGESAQGEAITRRAAQLEGSEPGAHPMQFEFFQHFTGILKLPEDVQPQTLTVEIEPTVKNLISSSRAYPWEPVARESGPGGALYLDVLDLTQPTESTLADPPLEY